jgi:cytosine/adenosine deaminase-related metal-dependent hydrolase
MHLLESRAQRTWADGAHPDGLLTFLDDIGLLTDRCWLAHGTQLRPDELDLLGRRGCGLSLNASSNLRLASGIAPVAAAVESIGRTAMGLDGLALSDDQDGWTELRLLRGLWQAQTGRKVAARAVLELACHPGRAAVGRAAPQLPRQGNVADYVLCDVSPWRHLLGRPDWPLEEIIVGAMSPDRVREVWVHGTCVWREGP